MFDDGGQKLLHQLNSRQGSLKHINLLNKRLLGVYNPAASEAEARAVLVAERFHDDAVALLLFLRDKRHASEQSARDMVRSSAAAVGALHWRTAPVAAQVTHELALGGVNLVAANDVLKLRTTTLYFLKPKNGNITKIFKTKARDAATTTACSKQHGTT